MRYFKYANDWDAVVLIDEADVYLEARSIENLRRNSVVSSKKPSNHSLLASTNTATSFSPCPGLFPRNSLSDHQPRRTIR